MHGTDGWTFKVSLFATSMTSSRAKPPQTGRRIASRCRGCDPFASIGCGSEANDRRGRSLPILCVADLFHPVHDLAIKCFLNGDVRHGCGRPGAVPVLL